MKIEKELIDETYQNYIKDHPSHKDFFHNVIEKDKTLLKIS